MYYEGKPVVTPRDNKVVLAQPLNVTSRDFTIPAGFSSDGASIPPLGWFLSTPFHPKVLAAAIIHDYMWKNNFPEKSTDNLFRLILIDDGVKEWKAHLMYYGVRLYRNFKKVLAKPFDI